MTIKLLLEYGAVKLHRGMEVFLGSFSMIDSSLVTQPPRMMHEIPKPTCSAEYLLLR
jgi:hypothetical protein